MKILALVLSLLCTSLRLSAVEIELKSTDTKIRATPSDHSEEAIKIIQSLSSCVMARSSPEEIKNCADGKVSKELDISDRDKLLAWFKLPFKLTYPEVCRAEETNLLPEETVLKTKLILCSQHKILSHERKVLFYFISEHGKLSLLNLTQ